MDKECNFSELSMNDLLAYYNANNALKNYYANEAQLNACYQTTKEKQLFDEIIKKQMKCNGVENKIIMEFEKRLIENK